MDKENPKFKVSVTNGTYKVYCFESGLTAVYFHQEGIDGYERIFISDEKQDERAVHGLKAYLRAEMLRRNLPELLDSGELTDDVKKALSVIK